MQIWEGAIMKYSKPTVNTTPKSTEGGTPRGTCTIYTCPGKYDCDGDKDFKCRVLYF